MSLRRRIRGLPALVGLALLVGACATTPIGVARLDTQGLHRVLTASILTSGEPSPQSMQVLRRSNLAARFSDDPEATLAELRAGLTEGGDAFRFLALAELSFLHAERSGKREYYLAAAAYAYAYLFPEEGSRPDPLNPGLRLAADLYNRGLTASFSAPEGDRVAIEAQTYALPFGSLELTVDPAEFEWGGYRFARFVAVGQYEVRGLRNRYRQAGVGAPLAAEVTPREAGPAAKAAQQRIPPRIRVPVTAFVRLDAPRAGVVSGRLRGRLELYAADEAATVTVRGQEVPLELEPTATLALMLEGAPVWDREIAGFRFGDESVLGDGLVMLHPYRPGRIPVVLVHGTASSPARWAEMVNELSNDPVIGRRVQFWLFMYNTGQPVLYSAHLLRQALKRALADFDPAGRDPALRRVVVVGHSQGGLLTKLLAVQSGTRFWDNVSSAPFAEVELAPETRALLAEGMFFEPVPEVGRVIFIATPHRGSFRAGGYALNLIRWLVRLPGTLASQMQDLLTRNPGAFGDLSMSQLPTSVDNMSPRSPFIRALSELPMDSRIATHSIIAVRGAGPFLGQTDGVVAYESAHIEGVRSERVVRSGHSTQSHPETIEEVRRILREHLGAR